MVAFNGTMRIEHVGPGDLISGFLPTDQRVVSITNNPYFPRRVDIVFGDPNNPALPTQRVTFNRNAMVVVSRAS